VAARTAELRSEIHERQQAERRLNVLQADLVQANKLAQLGQITAGVAHEINQPLATIRVLAENSLAVGAAKPALVSDNLGNIVRMSERIGHITGELRAFSRKASFDPEPVSLKETLDSSVLLNRSRLRDNKVRLVRDPIDAKLRVMAGRVRLEQVLVNLLQNAFEALEDTPGAEVRLSVTFDDDWVWLRVADNGPGLKPEVLAQLFTPFVTTKEKGLGLGLVIAHDILRDFGGELLAESSDKGAVFTLKLRKVTL
jgi:two-component system C4-dicarboxylate transport sensor histidine kinase DctB